MDVEVDKASSEEGRDIVDRGVEGKCSLDGARNRSICTVEGPDNGGTVLAHSARMEVGHGHLLDVGGIEGARGIGCIVKNDKGRSSGGGGCIGSRAREHGLVRKIARRV